MKIFSHLTHKTVAPKRAFLRNHDVVSDLRRSCYCQIYLHYMWQSWGMLYSIWFMTKSYVDTSAAAQVCFLFVWRSSSLWVWSVYRTLKIPRCCISTDAGPVVSFVYMASSKCCQPWMSTCKGGCKRLSAAMCGNTWQHRGISDFLKRSRKSFYTVI